MLITFGIQVPEMGGLLFELVGSNGGVVFWHRGPIVIKTGMISLTISISVDTGLAHCPAAGVNVYNVLPLTDVLMAEGIQVPEMGGMLDDEDGRDGGNEF